MRLHQDGSKHEWVAGRYWDLIITLDDATSEHYSIFFVEEEGTRSSFLGVKETIQKRGLFCSLYTDRGSHYWHTPKVGGKVDKGHFTQFRRGLDQLGIHMIAAYSPEARGRCERAFRTHQGRLPQERSLQGIVEMSKANAYLREVYLQDYNKQFAISAHEEGSAFVPWKEGNLDDYLCEQHERVVGKDNCVQYKGTCLQIPPTASRNHYAKTTVRVHEYAEGNLALYHGPRCLGMYDAQGRLA
jgi:hypothetical protein